MFAENCILAEKLNFHFGKNKILHLLQKNEIIIFLFIKNINLTEEIPIGGDVVIGKTLPYQTQENLSFKKSYLEKSEQNLNCCGCPLSPLV